MQLKGPDPTCSRCKTALPTERRDHYCRDCRREANKASQARARARKALARHAGLEPPLGSEATGPTARLLSPEEVARRCRPPIHPLFHEHLRPEVLDRFWETGQWDKLVKFGERSEDRVRLIAEGKRKGWLKEEVTT